MTLKRKGYLGNGKYCQNYDEFEVLSELPKECSILSYTDDEITIIDSVSDITKFYNQQDTDDKSYNYYALQLYVLNRKTGVTKYAIKRIAIKKITTPTHF